MKNLFYHLVGKIVVKLHYARKLDLYALPSIHAPTQYARAGRKAKISNGIRWAVWRRDNFTCVYCLNPAQELSLDHIVPESHGGEGEEDNLVTACYKCNNKKSSKSFERFIRSEWLLNRRKMMIAVRNSSTTKGTRQQSRLNDILLRNSRTTGTEVLQEITAHLRDPGR